MPQHRQVPTLQSVCLRNVGFTVERMAKKIATEKNVDEDVQQTREYLNKLITCAPHNLFEHIVIEVLEAVRRVVEKTSPSTNKMNILGRINETVLIPQLKSLNISVWPRKVTRKFYSNMQNLTGLEKLELAPLPKILKKKDIRSYITKSIPAMKKLKSFTFRYSCTDAIVRNIGNHCRDIEYLDIKESHLVTKRSIPHLLKCSNLKILKLSGTSIKSEKMTKIIIGLPNLLEVDYEDFDLVIELLRGSNCGPFGLRKAHPCDDFDDNLKVFVDMFPKTEYVEFHRPISELQYLSSLENLNTLIVRMCEIKYDYLKHLLELRGRNITSLILDSVKYVDIQHIIGIGRYCPNLKTLGLTDCEFTNSVMPSSTFENPLFKSLQNVYWQQYDGMEILEFVLSHAFNIQLIDVGYEFSTDITHALVENVLAANPMRSLEEFSVSKSTHLNMGTVELLLESCVNLKVLSRLERWRGIKKEELKNFKEYIASHNFDLQFVRTSEEFFIDNHLL